MAIRKDIRRNTRPDRTIGNPALGQLQVDAYEAVYEPPANGPFRCDNCIYYVTDAQPCLKVSDPIEAAGCCILFESGRGEAAPAAPEEEENIVKYRQAQHQENVVKSRQAQQRESAINVVIDLAVGRHTEPDEDDQ